VIGRATGSEVRVQAHGVAEEHAVLEHRGPDWYLVPRAPATFVGGERVDEPVRLTGTHIVGLGRVARLEVTVGE
jgi:pSer/pThr/pTyr-binding forkhead associated (FHA) protein